MKVNSWHITHDPLHLSKNKTNPAQLEEAAQVQGEDIVQATRGKRTLELGWYRDRYRVLLVEDENWSTPVRQIEAFDLQDALSAFRNLLV